MAGKGRTTIHGSSDFPIPDPRITNHESRITIHGLTKCVLSNCAYIPESFDSTGILPLLFPYLRHPTRCP